VTHVRKQLRDAVASVVTGLTSTGARVHKSRVLPLDRIELPALCVFARQDSPDYDNGAMGTTVVRVLEVHVQGYARRLDGPQLEDSLDAMAAEVETALFADTSLGGLAHGVRLGPQVLEVDGDGDQDLGVIDMVFEVIYRTAEGVPGVAV